MSPTCNSIVSVNPRFLALDWSKRSCAATRTCETATFDIFFFASCVCVLVWVTKRREEGEEGREGEREKWERVTREREGKREGREGGSVGNTPKWVTSDVSSWKKTKTNNKRREKQQPQHRSKNK